MLAKRVQEGVETAPKKRKTQNEREKLAEALKVLSKKSKDASSSFESESEDEEVDIFMQVQKTEK